MAGPGLQNGGERAIASVETACRNLMLDEILIADVDWSRFWRVDLDAGARVADASVLSATERERAERFRFEPHRQRFVACRLALRHLIGVLGGVAPHTVAYRDGAFGKPHLVHPAGFSFSLSHSEHLAVIGISARVEIGVDVELLRDIADADGIADRHFTAGERLALRGLSPIERNRAFLTGWTRKEASLKATGAGLTVALESFETGVSEAARRVTIPWPDSTGPGACVTVQSVGLDDAAILSIARMS